MCVKQGFYVNLGHTSISELCCCSDSTVQWSADGDGCLIFTKFTDVIYCFSSLDFSALKSDNT